GGGWVITAPPPGPVTAWRSTEWIIRLSARFLKRSSTVSPTLTRRKGPGTLPLNVQYVYVVSFARRPTTSTASRFTATVRGAPGGSGPSRSAGSLAMLTDGRAAATGGLAPPTTILTSIPAWRWPGREQKYANSPALSARNTVTLLAPLRFTRSVAALKSGNTTSCSIPSPLTSPICTMSPWATRSVGFTTPSTSPPTPTNASLPS